MGSQELILVKDGTDLAQVFNSYMEINGKSEIPTSEVNGQLLPKGLIAPSDLSGPLAGKTVTDLTNLMKNDSVYVVVRTHGEIQGVITPSNTGYTQASSQSFLNQVIENITFKSSYLISVFS